MIAESPEWHGYTNLPEKARTWLEKENKVVIVPPTSIGFVCSFQTNIEDSSIDHFKAEETGSPDTAILWDRVGSSFCTTISSSSPNTIVDQTNNMKRSTWKNAILSLASRFTMLSKSFASANSTIMSYVSYLAHRVFFKLPFFRFFTEGRYP